MSRPLHSPLPFHLEQGAAQGQASRPLPPGWLVEWDSQYNIPYWVYTLSNPPHSQWTSPFEDSSREQEHAAAHGQGGERGFDAAGSFQGGGGYPRQGYGQEYPQQQEYAPSSGYNPGYGGSGYPQQEQQQQQQQPPQAQSHNWLELGGAGIGGAAIGAFAEHEWEKHKQTEAYTSGIQEGELEERRKEQSLEAELQRVRYENEQLERQQQQAPYGYSGQPQGQGYAPQGQGPPPVQWGGGWEQKSDGRMGPYG